MEQQLRQAIPFEEFDYQALMGALANYSSPRDKVTDLLAKGIIIRVKKGLYIFGEKWRQRPYSREVLANLLYGPSCVSLDYALNYHGLTPERVEALTSVTPKRGTHFMTPVGMFLYSNVPLTGFAVGLERVELEDGRGFLIATPEKALADKVRQDRGLGLRTQKDTLEYLVENLRIDESLLGRLNMGLLFELSQAYRSPRVALLAGLIKRLASEKGIIMREALTQMLAKYDCRRVEDTTQALREILQELALLGLWRAKFFDKAAFYGGTALRILYGLDRFSEDLDFSLLHPMPDFKLERYSDALERELAAFGFNVRVEQKGKAVATQIQSAFLKADTANELLVIESGVHIQRQIPDGKVIRIKVEVDTNPPPGFTTDNRFLLLPIPFSVRTYRLPDLFAGKMHAVLCRRWKNRVKGRDWYDLVWYCTHHPQLHLAHLKQRMCQSGHWDAAQHLDQDQFHRLITAAIERLDIDQARKEVLPFVRHPEALVIWSHEFFFDVIRRIRCI